MILASDSIGSHSAMVMASSDSRQYWVCPSPNCVPKFQYDRFIKVVRFLEWRFIVHKC